MTPFPVYSAPHKHTHTNTHTHTPNRELHMRPHFIITTHYYIVFYHFNNS